MQRLLALATLLFLFIALPCQAQYDRAPEDGGFTKSLGLPKIWKLHGGFQAGTYNPANDQQLTTEFNFGVFKDLMNPVVGGLGISAEGYVGNRNTRGDGGGRLLLEIPVLMVAGGVDYNVPNKHADFILSLKIPFRRGGIFGGGTEVRFNWLPTRGHTSSLGIKAPLWQSYLGKTRSKRDFVKIRPSDTEPVPYSNTETTLHAAIIELRDRSRAITIMTTPFLDQNASNNTKALAKLREDLERVKEHMQRRDERFPDGHTVAAEVQVYHEALDRAFSIAASGDPMEAGESTPMGRLVAEKAKEIILEEVVFPYNQLLGRKKKEDTSRGFAMLARGAFADWLITEAPVPEERDPAVFYVFETLLEIIELNRSYQHDQWNDGRLVWMPLQYALRPEQHDTQAEIDDFLGRAAEIPFTEGNDIFYVINEQFQFEVARMIHAAEKYHVLWIHDIQGKNANGDPDQVSFAQVVSSYYGAMTEKVKAYDETGTFPVYMIFLDQHYYEVNKGRPWVEQLQEPLEKKISISDDAMNTQLDSARAALWEAVEGSKLLQAEIRQYGEKWLYNFIKVHVNITNPSDMTYRGRQIIPLVGLPDNTIRDHRKISFYDVSEDHPYEGEAIYTGMGIGEHYTGTSWEDRAIMVQGPAALALKHSARRLLLTQGFTEEEIPYPLKPRTLAPDYDAIVQDSIRSWLDAYSDVSQVKPETFKALEIHNDTDYRHKGLNVLRATLFNLMPSGCVVKIPDSLWNATFWASMLSGMSLRGCRVLLIGPSVDNAPSSSFMTMSRANELFSRMIVVQEVLGEEIAAAGGMLKTGLYDLDIDVRDIPGRAEVAAERILGTPFLKELYGFDPSVLDMMASADSFFATNNISFQDDIDGASHKPFLHMKVQFFASQEGWDRLMAQPEWKALLGSYLLELNRQFEYTEGYRDAKTFSRALDPQWFAVGQAFINDLSREEQRRIIHYLTVGAVNQNYRSMLMDGEVMVAVSGWQSLSGLMDMIMMVGNSTWVDTIEELNELLPPQSEIKRKIARAIKAML